MREPQAVSFGAFPMPGKALRWVMGVLLAVWVLFAVGINYGGLDLSTFLAFTGNRDAILHGEIWRLLTAGLLHLPTGNGSVSHIAYALFGLFFLAPTLEASWGGRRMVGFLVLTSVF